MPSACSCGHALASACEECRQQGNACISCHGGMLCGLCTLCDGSWREQNIGRLPASLACTLVGTRRCSLQGTSTSKGQLVKGRASAHSQAKRSAMDPPFLTMIRLTITLGLGTGLHCPGISFYHIQWTKTVMRGLIMVLPILCSHLAWELPLVCSHTCPAHLQGGDRAVHAVHVQLQHVVPPQPGPRLGDCGLVALSQALHLGSQGHRPPESVHRLHTTRL